MIIHLDPELIARECKKYGIKNYCTDAWVKEYYNLASEKLKSKTVSKINQDLEKTKKAVVVLGCSYAVGQGAFDEPLLEKLKPIRDDSLGSSSWDYKKKGHSDLDLLESSKDFFCPYSNGFMDTAHMELNNSFLSQIAQMHNETHEEKKVTPINLGHAAHSNNAAVERIFRYPIDWHKCEEITVIWSYTDINRFCVPVRTGANYDIIHADYQSIWWTTEQTKPYEDQGKWPPGDNKKEFYYHYTQNVFSDQSNAWRFLQEANTLKQWIKQFSKANLVIFPAFTPVSPKMLNKEMVPDKIATNDKDFLTGTIDTLYPKHFDLGYDSFLDFCLSQENIDPDEHADYIKNGGGFGMLHKIFHGGYVSPCGHPGIKGHTELAKWLLKKGILTDYE